MPFKDNPYFRALFDVVDGGKPKAWQCIVSIKVIKSYGNNTFIGQGYCGKICKSLRGMKLHLKQIHNFREQSELFDNTRAKD